MIRQAKTTDVATIMSIYHSARQFMRSRGNTTQWVNGYPSVDLIMHDIAEGHCYIDTDTAGHILAVFAFIIGDDPTYRKIDGAWLNDRPYGTIHRLASSGEVPGAFQRCLDYCLTQIDNIRVDTHADNLPMRKAIERARFNRCGIIYVADGTPRLAFQLCRSGMLRHVATEKYQQLKARLEGLADSEKAASMAAYMRNQFKFYGVQAIDRNAVFNDMIKVDSNAGIINWILLDLCFDDEHREFQYFVLNYLKAMKQHLTFNDIPQLFRYIKNKQWWDTIDGLDRVIGSIAFTDSRVNDLMLKWSTDDDFWIRRVAIDHQIGRKDRTDQRLLEAILVNNFGSKEFFINKAIGWSLREYSKTNPRWVTHFIATYRSRMAPLSIREASKRL